MSKPIKTQTIIFPLIYLTLMIIVGLKDVCQPSVYGAQEDQNRVSQPETLLLKTDEFVQQEIGKEGYRCYRIHLDADQFLKLVVEQNDIDISISLLSLSGDEIKNIDNSKKRPECLYFISDASSDYLIKIFPATKNISGYYSIKVEELRKFTSIDQTRVEAEQLSGNAETLLDQQNKVSINNAIDIYKKTLPLWQILGDKDKESLTVNNIGWAYEQLGEKRKALEYYQQSLTIDRDSSTNYASEAATLNNIGRIYIELGDNINALKNLSQALLLLQNSNDILSKARILNNIGLAYFNQDESAKAIEFYNQAMPLWQKLGNKKGEAITLTNIATSYGNLGEKQQELEIFFKSLALSRDAKDRRSEIGNLVSIGNQYLFLGNYYQALSYLKESYNLADSAGDRTLACSSLNSIGNLYIKLGDYQKGLDDNIQAFEIARTIKIPRLEIETLNGIARALILLQDYRKAIDYLEQALVLCKKIGSRSSECSTLNIIGISYGHLKDYQRALASYKEAEKLAREIGVSNLEISVFHNLGETYIELGEQQVALDYYNEALQLAEKDCFLLGRSTILYKLAKLFRNKGELVKASSLVAEAIKLNELLRSSILIDEYRISFFSSVQNYYEFYIDLLMQEHKINSANGYDILALQASEAAKSRSLIDMLTESQINIQQGVNRELVMRKNALLQKLNARQQSRIHLFNKRYSKEQEEVFTKEIEQILDEYRAMQIEIRKQSPGYSSLTQPQQIDIKELQQQIDDNTILLEYKLGKDNSFLWAVTNDSVTSYELPKREVIEPLARQAYELLTARHYTEDEQQSLSSTKTRAATLKAYWARIAQSDKEYLISATALSHMLLDPVAHQIGDRRLVIISDEILQYIPFSALPQPGIKASTSSTNWLIANHEIINAPSLSTITILRQDAGKHLSASKQIAVFADPVFSLNDERVTQSSKQPNDEEITPSSFFNYKDAARDMNIKGQFQRLKYSRFEAETIATLFKPEDVLKALDFDASREAVLGQDLEKYKFIHFATHGLINDNHPVMSGLLLSLVGRDGKLKDGFLHLEDIYNLKLSADLIVLSACKTGLGKNVKGEGLIGLTRGFMYAGAPRIVASLWDADDAATSDLMRIFYQNMFLKERLLTPSKALCDAQRKMSINKKYSFPYYWAGFTFQGEWR